jgi:hypothetical protein
LRITSQAQVKRGGIGKKKTHNDVLRLIPLLSKVQVVLDEVGLVGNKFNLHVELTPTLF